MSKLKYPVNIGDHYWSIEKKRITKNVWSQEMQDTYDANIKFRAQVFQSEEDAIQRWKEIEALNLLDKCYSLLYKIEQNMPKKFFWKKFFRKKYNYTERDVYVMLNNIEHIKNYNTLKH